MRVCIVVLELAKAGGVDEIVTNLAVSLKEAGVTISLLTADFATENNQYRTQLKENRIPLRQLPEWLAVLSKDWPTKERFRARLMNWLRPIVWFLAVGVLITRRVNWTQAVASSEGWLGGQVMTKLIAPDHRRKLLLWQLTWWRARWRPDILHVHGYTNLVTHVPDWAYKRGIPAIYHEHSTPGKGTGRWDGYEPVNRAAAILAVSNACAEGLREVCGVVLPILVVPVLVRDPGRITLSHGGRSLQATTFANLYPVKGLEYLLQAIAYVRERHPYVEFRIYGEGPLREQLIQQAADLGFDGEAIFQGVFRRSDLSQIMFETDIFVMSSISESIGVSLIEAKAYGRCIVATAVGGIPEIIIHERSGLLCPPRDPVALAEQLLRVIVDSSLRTELGRQARLEYEESWFNPEKAGPIYLGIYQNVLSNKSPLKGGRGISLRDRKLGPPQ